MEVKAIEEKRISFGIIGRTWAPLALNWLLMAIEGPILVGLVSRLPAPAENLAAFQVAFSVALIVEAPIMMLLSAGAALGQSRTNYEKLWLFASSMNLPLSALMGFLGIPSVFLLVNQHLWKLPPDLALKVAGAVLLLTPWPAAIGYRRLWQGILIRWGKARLVAWGTLWRLLGMGTGALVGALLLRWEGAHAAALALSCGVVSEMLIIRISANATLKKLPTFPEKTLSLRAILSFYFPLLLTSLLNVALSPLLTTLIAQGKEPIPSLAAYPVVTNTVFLFSCLGVAYQEVVVVLLGTRVGKHLWAFAHIISLGTCLALGLLAMPFLRRVWFERVFALPLHLQPIAGYGLWIWLFMPAIVVYTSYIKGAFIHAHQTRWNLLSAVMEVSATLLLAVWFLFGLEWMAIYGALAALIIARGLTALLFYWVLRKGKRPYLCTEGEIAQLVRAQDS